ncbi:MAG: M28 family peptidase [Spirochaetota bacterium]
MSPRGGGTPGGRTGLATETDPFGPDFRAFLAPDADRLSVLISMLVSRGIPSQVLAIAGRRHLLVRACHGKPAVILVAHYDRVPGSPGALDNSAACLVLVRVAERMGSSSLGKNRDRHHGGEGKSQRGGLLILFTDGEEAPATEGALSQGAYSLGLGLKSILGGGQTPPGGYTNGAPGGQTPRKRATRPAILVLDVIGKGSRLLVSTSARRAFEPGEDPEGAAILAGTVTAVRKAAAKAGIGEPLELPLPWSDDLGFSLAGLPSIGISLLPAAEAERLSRAVSGLALLPGAETLGKAWPGTWALTHSPQDSIECLEPEALRAMEDFCLAFCHEAG